ncbi:unnamed protein product, partial [Schistosoma rodhaini]
MSYSNASLNPVAVWYSLHENSLVLNKCCFFYSSSILYPPKDNTFLISPRIL